MRLDYCRVMKGIKARPGDHVHLTLGQFLELKAHLKTCAPCAKIVDEVNAENPPKPFGLGDRQPN